MHLTLRTALVLSLTGLLASAAAGAPFRDGDRVVFFGDSITHHGRYHELIALYYATRFPGADIRLFNAGESGGSAGSAMRRLADDVAARKPTQVAVMFGMNDVWRNDWPRAGATSNVVQRQKSAVANFKKNTTALVAKVRAACGNPKIVYLTPSPYDQSCLIGGKPTDLVCNDGLEILGNWVRAQAAAEKATCVDLQTFLRELNRREQLKNPSWSFMRLGAGGFDRIHPGAFGHQFFAYEFLKAQGAPAEVAKLSFEARLGLTNETRNAVIRDFASTPTSLVFTACERALPYPFDDQTAKACDYAPIVNDLNRETFRVVGLEPGLYELAIDGAAVGRWTTEELSAGVNLALNPKTPQYAQAQKVRELNARQWKEQVKARDVRMWRLWQKGKAPVEDPAKYREWFMKKYPGGKTKDFFGYMAKQYLDYGEKLGEVDAACDRLYGEVRAAAKPVPHAWRLVRVGDEARATCVEAHPVAAHAPSLLPAGGAWKLVWHDEFDGTELDTTKWGFRTNFWGQNAHWFAKPEDNAVEVKDGCVHLKLVKKPDGQFVSPQLQTGELIWDFPQDPNRRGFWPLPKRNPPKFVHRFGYYECRFRLQKMPGWWSAFWMQTETQGCSLDPELAGIEQDIMESFEVGEIIRHCYHMNGYGPDYRGFNSHRDYRLPAGFKGRPYSKVVGTDRFVTIGLLWEPDGYTVFIDGRQSGYRHGKGPGEAVSQVPEFVLLTTEAKWYRNNRMTGKGVPELEAAWKAGDAFVVDYVRVFDRN